MKKFYELKIRRYGDERGFLTTFEAENDVPFEIKRVYYLSEVEKRKTRACHAHKESKRVLSAAAGSCEVRLFDGKENAVFRLDSPEKAIYFDKGVWCELGNFSEGAVVLAFSDHPYFEEEYIRNYDEFLEFIKEQKSC